MNQRNVVFSKEFSLFLLAPRIARPPRRNNENSLSPLKGFEFTNRTTCASCTPSPSVHSNPQRLNKGQGTTELALLLPILFLLFFGAVQVIIYLQSSTMTQYASFVSARGFQVYGDRDVKSIGYTKVASSPFTNDDQTIAEAAAETVLFESLMWEQQRIKVQDTVDYFNRVYEDGNNVVYAGYPTESSNGVVQVNFQCTSSGCDAGSGVEVSYCVPIVFPGVDLFFKAVSEESPCKVTQNGRTYSGIMITKKTEFGREPTEK